MTSLRCHSYCSILAMAGSVHNSLNQLFSSNLTRSDEENLASVIEDYFCFDSDGGEDESDDYGKCIHNRMNSIIITMNLKFF